MTNILLLPQITAAFTVANNADWRDVIQFYQPNSTTPLDLTGISFRMVVRTSPGDTNDLIDASTANGLLVNGGTLGTLTWAVPVSATASPVYNMAKLQPATYYADLLASDSTATINLCQQSGPATVTVNQGVTR